MRIDQIADRDAFLVEDLILTVTNFRGLLGWILDDKTPEEMRRVGVARLDRQLALLAEQAGQMRRLDDAVRVIPADAAERSIADPALPDLGAETTELAVMIDVLDSWLSERQVNASKVPAGTTSGPADCGLTDDAQSEPAQAPVAPGSGLACWLEELSDDETPVLESDASENPLGAMIFRTRRTDLER